MALNHKKPVKNKTVSSVESSKYIQDELTPITHTQFVDKMSIKYAELWNTL